MSTRTSQNACACIALTLCLLLCGAQKAHAQQEVRYPQLLEHDGKRFAAYINEINGTPTWIINTDSLDFTLGSSLNLTSESEVETKADAFLDAHKDVFGVNPEILEGPTIIRSGEVWLISYQQVFNKLNVLGAQLGLTVTRQGRLLAAGARLFPKVNVNTKPGLSAEAAMRAATGYASIPDADVSAKNELVILAVEEDGAYVYGLVWEITVSNHNLNPPQSKTFLVDAHSGKILQEYDNGGHGGHPALAEPDQANKSGGDADPAAKDERAAAQSTCAAISGSTHGIEGHISLNYYQSPADSTLALNRVTGAAFPYAKFSVSGGSPSYSCEGYADENGKYSAGLSNAGTYTVTFYVESDTVSIGRWELGTGEPSLACQQQVSFTMDVDGNEKLDYGWGWGVSGDGGTSSFALNSIYNTIAMRNYFRNTFGTYEPDTVITISVRPGLRAYAEAGLARISMGGAAAMSNEVVMHEYAHLVVNPLVLPGRGDQRKPVQEAAADYFAADVTKHALWGGPVPDSLDDPALYAADGDLSALIRNLANDCTAEDNFSECGTGVYEKSLVLSGAVWSLRGIVSSTTQYFYRALAMKPQPPDFETVARNMHKVAATVSEQTAIYLVFSDRLELGPMWPTGLVATCSTSGNIVLTWTDTASNEAGYEVVRQTDDGARQLVVRLGPNIETYSDTGASCGGSSQTTYSYHVTVFSTSGSANTDTLRTVSVPATYPANQSQGKLRASSLVVPEALQTDEPVTFATELRGTYPNPFNPVTTISYALKEEDQVSLVIYNVLGQRVAVLVDGVQAAGEHTIAFDGNRLPSGPYFLRMETSAYRQTRMMMLAK